MDVSDGEFRLLKFEVISYLYFMITVIYSYTCFCFGSPCALFTLLQLDHALQHLITYLRIILGFLLWVFLSAVWDFTVVMQGPSLAMGRAFGGLAWAIHWARSGSLGWAR